MNDKILNIKIEEDDYDRLLIAVATIIQELNKNKKSTTNVEEIDRIEFDIYKYKMLVSKLKTCRLYNED